MPAPSPAEVLPSGLLQAAIEAADVCIWKTDPRTELVWLNESASRLFGIGSNKTATRAELHRKIHPYDRQRVHVAVAQTLEGILPVFQEEFRVLDPGNGSGVRWLLARGRLQEDPQDGLSYFIGSATDITYRKLVEAELRQQQLEQGHWDQQLRHQVALRTNELEQKNRFIHGILNASFNGIYALQAEHDEKGAICDFRYLFVNDLVAKFLQAPPEEVVGRRLLEILPENRTNGFFEEFCHVLREGKPFRNTTYFSSEKFSGWFEYVVWPTDATSLVVTVQDITEHKKALIQIEEQHQQLERHLAELQRTNANLESFAYAASHDLREPLRKINVFADRIRHHRGENLTPEQLNYLDRIETAARRMNTLVEDLLTYAGTTQGSGQLQPTDLNALVSMVIEDLEVEITEANAEIALCPLPMVQGQPRQLQQLFHNLIANALKYRRPGLPATVNINYARLKGADTGCYAAGESGAEQWFHRIEICDQGIGFEPVDNERVFQVFTRLHGAHTYRGTGVGLSIARRVAENHGGLLRAKGEPGSGACFTLLLPDILAQ